jgi:hypothetical protein
VLGEAPEKEKKRKEAAEEDIISIPPPPSLEPEKVEDDIWTFSFDKKDKKKGKKAPVEEVVPEK